MKLVSKAVFLAVAMVASFAYAGTSSGLITALKVHTGDVVMFSTGPINQKATCGTAGDEWALSLNTPTGRAMYALVLSASAQGKAVLVTGTNACNAWADCETPYWIQLQ